MDEKKNAVQEWLETATKGIRFWPDRWAVEAELREHLEDKTADMARIFHIEGEEAEREALKRMGDPEEIGKKLAKVHRPWLGYLWMASRVLRIILLTLAVLYMQFAVDHYGDAVLHETHYDPPMAVEPARVKLGGYTFQIVCAQVNRELKVVVRGSSPRFWERVVIPISRVTVVMPDGRRFYYGMEATPDIKRFYSDEEGKPKYALTALDDRWSVFYRDCRVEVYGAPCQVGDRIRVELDFPVGTVELSAQVGEG